MPRISATLRTCMDLRIGHGTASSQRCLWPLDWPGAFGCRFWEDPAEAIVTICLYAARTQAMADARMMAPNILYSAIMD